MRRLAALALLPVLLVAPLAAAAQSIQTYTENFTGSGSRPLGYPVPVPVASLEAVDGFRDYDSLHARLQSLALQSDELSAHEVGTTQQYGRTEWAYRVGDADAVDAEGAPEAAFFINAGIHAREWGTQEIATWLVERMVEGAGDGGLVRYLLDTTQLVIIPVHNIDGFLQTQRYPTQVIVGRDPRQPSDWPRDGRMRRKNMRGADEVLETFGDHLRGIDLNRNHPPLFGGSGSSGNPDELTYRGSAPHSEAENNALVQAILLAGPDRLRLGIDIHSFSQVFYSSNTGRSRLNAIQSRLLDRLTRHHRIASRRADGTAGVSYRNIPDLPSSGMGVTAEYLAYEYLVPAWTLEIEPQQGPAQYGGSSDSHGGFILPASEVRRVREAWAESHLVAFYFMAGAPHLAEVRVHDAASGALVSRQRWQRQGGVRAKIVDAAAGLASGRRYRAELVFSKPMRFAADNGTVAGFPGLGTTAQPAIALAGAGGTLALSDAAGAWQATGARYAYDTYAIEFEAPALAGDYTLQVDTTDAAGQKLDADPATPVDWASGAWTGWEDAAGVAGDVGGADARTQLAVADSGFAVLGYPAALGEGDVGTLRLQRVAAPATSAIARVRVAGAASTGGCAALAAATAQWEPSQGGERQLQFCVDDDLDVQPAGHSLELVVETAQGSGAFEALATLQVAVLDNDGDARAVVRGGSGSGLLHALGVVRYRASGPVDVVIDGGEQLIGSGPTQQCENTVVEGPLVLYGNHARIRHADGAGDCALLHADGDGVVDLRDLELLGTPTAGTDLTTGLLTANADLVLRRVVLRDESAQGGQDVPLLAASGATMELERSALTGTASPTVAAATFEGDAFALRTSAVTGLEAPALVDGRGGAAGAFEDSTLDVAEAAGAAVETAGMSATDFRGNLLQAGSAARLCKGSGAALASAGHNVASDTSCATTAGSDLAPLRLQPTLRDGPTGAPFPTGGAIDLGGTCAAVDLRGAPRPQAATAGAEARCDAGAIELGVNPYRGLWIPDRPGHGVDIHTAGNVLFLTWYTYHADGSPAAYLAAAPLTGPVWRATLETAVREGDGTIRNIRVGEIELDFASDIRATLRWRFGNAQSWGEEGIGAYLFAEGEPRFESTGTWYPPTESGHGLTVTRRGEVTGMVLYYYDGEGALRWALGQGSGADVVDVALFGYTGFCPDCDADAHPPVAAPVGTMRVQFLTPVRARFWVDVGYGSGPRFVRNDQALVPINDPVDNRRAVEAASGAD